jgi:pimeloyl-ACP methyl ester carboxylesterase
MRLLRSPLLLALLLLASACGPSDERVFFLRSGSADLPVLVQGPEDADTLVLFVHGGPGGSGLVVQAALPAAFRPISERHLLAFYEQRGAGASQGHTHPSELTVARHVQDLDDVLALLRAQYPGVRKVFLLGHSWGGSLTAQYLVDPARAAGVTGWISVDGATSFPRMLELSRAWAVAGAQARAASAEAGSEESRRWQEVLAWYAARPVLDAPALGVHMRNVDALGGTTHDPAHAAGDRLGAAFFSPYSVGSDMHNAAVSPLAMAEELMSFDVLPQLAGVRLPALFLHGEHDGRVPLRMGEETAAALGTPAEHKTFVRFPRSAHRPFDEEPEAFARSVLDFVARYR